jgi:hypothetical protein
MADGTTQRPLTIKFAPPLEERNQGWEDNQIFVSLSTHNGAPASGVDRNVSTHIKHILTKYSQLTADATTFASVLATTAVWKSDFAILQTGDAWQVCQDIAWQMRCSLLQIGNNVKIKYLSITEPPGSPDGNVDVKDDYILLDEGSAIVENDLEDRVTVFTAIYQNSYANPVPQKIIKRVNTTVLGERLGSFNFTIFQNKELVEQSAEWWSQHYGRVWKKIIVTGPLPLITFEPFDLCKVNLPNIIHTTNFRGIVESMTHDTLNHRIGLQIWTPVEGGTNSTSSKGWLNVADPSVAAQADPFDNLTTGTDDLVAWAPSADGK